MTAVEWLQSGLELIMSHEEQMQTIGLFEQAKDLEKEQIIKAVFDSMGTNLDPNIGRAELYYNETYKNTKE